MTTVNAREAAKRFGALLEAADAGPVTILKDGRPRAVIISARRFGDYEKAYERESGERFADMIHLSLDLFREGKLGKGQKALALARRLRLNEDKPDDGSAAASLLQAQEK